MKTHKICQKIVETYEILNNHELHTIPYLLYDAQVVGPWNNKKTLSQHNSAKGWDSLTETFSELVVEVVRI